jgi:hypothetical protein
MARVLEMADGRDYRGGGAAGGGRADVNGNAAGNSAGYAGGGSNQRECLTYGTEKCRVLGIHGSKSQLLLLSVQVPLTK